MSSVMKTGAVALVTGASSGIGKAVADDLLEAGLRVICLGRSAERLAEAFPDETQTVLRLGLDVADPDFAAKLQDALPADWSEIDILVASAGSDVGGRRRFDAGDMADWAQTIETNVTGLMRACHAVLPGMLERGRGHVVTLGSIAGLYTYPGASVYAATKHAVHAFTDGLRQDFPGEAVRITEVLPGMVRTGFAAARHKGDEATAEAFYDSWPATLTAADISASVLFALSQPDHVNIAQIVVTPTGAK